MYQQYVARNPVTGEPLSPEEAFSSAQRTAQRLQEQGKDAYPIADGRVLIRRSKSDRHGASMRSIKKAQQEALIQAAQITAMRRHQEFMNTPVNPDNLTPYGRQFYNQ